MCKNCGRETKNPIFCSRSCAAQTNNRLFPKRNQVGGSRRPKGRHCRKCKTFDASLSRKKAMCDSCNTKPEFYGQDCSVGELRAYLVSLGVPRWNIHTRLRDRARRNLIVSGADRCVVCGYTNHWQAAHIKAVVSFPDTALLSEINDISNLVALCPNHHWEYDHGMLELSP